MSTDTVFALLGLCAEMSTLGMPRQFFNISKIGDCWEKIWIYCQTWQKYICCFSDVVSTEAFESSVEHQVSSSACDISLISLETAWDSRLVTACDSWHVFTADFEVVTLTAVVSFDGRLGRCRDKARKWWPQWMSSPRRRERYGWISERSRDLHIIHRCASVLFVFQYSQM